MRVWPSTEFGPALDDERPVEFGVGVFGHAVGEWTDDTSMASPLLQALADDEVAGGRRSARPGRRRVAHVVEDVHNVPSRRRVLHGLQGAISEDAARTAALSEHERTGRTSGNGSLMRTGPIALGFLGDGQEVALVEAAAQVAKLTHWDDDNADACAIWCLAIRHAILTGELDIRGQVQWVPAARQTRWAALIDEALRPGFERRDFAAQNGLVVEAFQAALSGVAGSFSVTGALELAIRAGGDTDTVSDHGSLAGAVAAASVLPWHLVLHGWPGLRADDLTRLAVLAARGGAVDGAAAGRCRRVSRSSRTATSWHATRTTTVLWIGSMRHP